MSDQVVEQATALLQLCEGQATRLFGAGGWEALVWYKICLLHPRDFEV